MRTPETATGNELIELKARAKLRIWNRNPFPNCENHRHVDRLYFDFPLPQFFIVLASTPWRCCRFSATLLRCQTPESYLQKTSKQESPPGKTDSQAHLFLRADAPGGPPPPLLRQRGRRYCCCCPGQLHAGHSRRF